MIPTLVALAVLAPPQEGQWGPTTLSPKLLATRVDARLATLSNALVSYRYSFDRQALGSGYADCEGTIVRPGVFWLQIPNVDPSRRAVLEHELWVADGKRFGAAIQPTPVPPGPIARRPARAARPTKNWFVDFSRVIFSGLGRPTHPMSALLEDASASGFKTVVQSRTLKMQGHTILSHRVVLTKGALRYEIVIDGHGYLPVTVLNTAAKDNTRWSAVRWNLRPGKLLDPKIVEFRKAGAIRPLAPAPQGR